jgi:hypothetical protein
MEIKEPEPTTSSHASHKSHHRRVVSPTQKAFNLWGIIVIVWAFYRSTIGATSPMTFDELIFKPVIFLWPVLYYVKAVEHKTWKTGLWLSSERLLSHVQFASIISIPLFLFTLYVMFITRSSINIETVGYILALSVAMSLTEETLSRGFVARHIWEETHSILKTIFQASMLHMFLRIPRIMTMPELFGQKLIMYFAAEILLSFALTGVLLYRKSMIPVYALRMAATFALLVLMT